MLVVLSMIMNSDDDAAVPIAEVGYGIAGDADSGGIVDDYYQ
jgi:hypothetical protein